MPPIPILRFLNLHTILPFPATLNPAPHRVRSRQEEYCAIPCSSTVEVTCLIGVINVRVVGVVQMEFSLFLGAGDEPRKQERSGQGGI